MSSEHRLDRLEKIVRLVVKEGLRERREMRDRINALISAQMRDEEALTQYKVRTEEAMAHLANAQANTEEALAQLASRTEQLASRTGEEMSRLARAQANTEESLKALINTVIRIANERGNGKT
jgi:multidrug resistance efflux pump